MAKLAASRQRRQVLSRPLQQAMASKLDSAATLQPSEADRPKVQQSEEWRDARFKRTHIDYSTCLRRGKAMPHSLQDLQVSTISMPLQNPEAAAQGAPSSVAVKQGSTSARRSLLGAMVSSAHGEDTDTAHPTGASRSPDEAAAGS